jgi:hypothetical protein
MHERCVWSLVLAGMVLTAWVGAAHGAAPVAAASAALAKPLQAEVRTAEEGLRALHTELGWQVVAVLPHTGWDRPLPGGPRFASGRDFLNALVRQHGGTVALDPTHKLLIYGLSPAQAGCAIVDPRDRVLDLVGSITPKQKQARSGSPFQAASLTEAQAGHIYQLARRYGVFKYRPAVEDDPVAARPHLEFSYRFLAVLSINGASHQSLNQVFELPAKKGFFLPDSVLVPGPFRLVDLDGAPQGRGLTGPWQEKPAGVKKETFRIGDLPRVLSSEKAPELYVDRALRDARVLLLLDRPSRALVLRAVAEGLWLRVSSVRAGDGAAVALLAPNQEVISPAQRLSLTLLRRAELPRANSSTDALAVTPGKEYRFAELPEAVQAATVRVILRELAESKEATVRQALAEARCVFAHSLHFTVYVRESVISAGGVGTWLMETSPGYSQNWD